MMILITYDVNTQSSEGRSRLRRVSNACLNYGQRVQFSVFECKVTPAQEVELRHKIESMINLEEDSVRIYYLGSDYASKITHLGMKKPIDLDGSLIY